MQEGGILNRDMARVLARMGHLDELIVCDAGFPVPDCTETIDLSLAENRPRVPEVLALLRAWFSVEKMIVAEETATHSPALLREVHEVLGVTLPLETIPHSVLKFRSRGVKAIIRTGDFTAYANVLIVSGAGERWFVEKP